MTHVFFIVRSMRLTFAVAKVGWADSSPFDEKLV